MHILGINAVYHESAACLLDGGRLLSLMEEERFTGIRHGKEAKPYGAWLLPFLAINACLEREDASLQDIEHIAYSFQPGVRLRGNLGRIFTALLAGDAGPLQRELSYWYFNRLVAHFLIEAAPRKKSLRKRFLVAGKPSWKFHFIEHHLAHAASTFFVSPFDEAAILSIDGIGETACTLMAKGEGSRIAKVKEIPYPHSLGFFYEEVTTFLGFQRNHDEYKVMALAAFGQPRYYDALRELILLKPDGCYEVKIDFHRSSLLGTPELHKALGVPRLWGAPLTERHADIAASAQKVLEDTVLHMLAWLHGQTGSDGLCLAGGVALNCVMNERIREESPFKRVWVQPAANDAGTALGAALWVAHAVQNQPRAHVMEHVYWGPEFSDTEIEAKLLTCKIPYRRVPNIARACAELIAQGRLVGWFQGRMEWGPRALGNRSILADPRDPIMRDKVNSIKGREEFRPLAPAVLEESAGDYFRGGRTSPFMLFAQQALSDKQRDIPAVVHVDGTARVQTVNKKQNPLFYELITEFGKMTGIPVVVNTSLNYQGKPIVATPDQALDCFYNSGLDYLALGSFLIGKEVVENDEWLAIAKRGESLGLPG
jgi:carbamoyltransferase